jgi:hypothetical protein
MTKQIIERAALIVALLTFIGVSEGRADVLYNNLAATPDGLLDNIGSDWGPLADSFSTGASSFDFTSLTVLLAGTESTGTITAYLLSDSSTSPGTVLDTIGQISETGITGTPSDFTLNTSIVLNPDTRYWIELTDTDNAATWAWSYDTSGPGVAGEYFSNYGGTGSPRVVANVNNGPYQMEVSGTSLASVPEPRTISLLLAAGLVGLALLRARTKTQSV